MAFSRDDHWMQLAFLQAQEALKKDEVPVGAVVVLNDNLIGQGHNLSISTNDPTAHAEIVALRDAANNVGNYRLVDATLYVTLEPCLMCAGALVHARVGHVVYGALDPKSGSVSSQCCVFELPFLNHTVQARAGVLAEQCGDLLKAFFRAKRG